MKNINKIIIVILLISVITNVFQFVFYKKNIKEEKIVLERYDETYEFLNSITLKNFESKKSAKESFFVYMGKSSCSDCSLFWKNFKNILITYNLYDSILYVNAENFKKDDFFKNLTWKQFKEYNEIKQVPALLFIEDGKLKDHIEWDIEQGLSSDKVVEWLTKHNIIF